MYFKKHIRKLGRRGQFSLSPYYNVTAIVSLSDKS